MEGGALLQGFASDLTALNRGHSGQALATADPNARGAPSCFAPPFLCSSTNLARSGQKPR